VPDRRLSYSLGDVSEVSIVFLCSRACCRAGYNPPWWSAALRYRLVALDRSISKRGFHSPSNSRTQSPLSPIDRDRAPIRYATGGLTLPGIMWQDRRRYQRPLDLATLIPGGRLPCLQESASSLI
jgi:hypothetical protein